MRITKLGQLVFIFFLSISSFLQAQNREIQFEHTTLQEVLQKAQKADKPVFVDCYTEYCGPCKAMAATVFKTDSVADFFNKTFINLKMDMLSADGKQYASTYKVGAYPTFLILDNKGKEIYKFVGGQSAAKFMGQIRSGINPKNRLQSMNKTFASGKYTDDFIQEYIKLKISLFELKDAKDIAQNYINSVPVSRYTLPSNWFLFTNRYLADVQSYDSHFLLEHWKEFLTPIGSSTVYKQIGDIYRNLTDNVLHGWYFKDHKFNVADFDYYKQQIIPITIDNKQDYISMTEICRAACLKDTAKVRRLLCDLVPDFSTENQQILFAAIGSYLNFRSEELHGLALKIVHSGKKSNLTNYLKTFLKPDEVYSGEKYDVPNLNDKIGSTSVVPFFDKTADKLWYRFEDSKGNAHYYGYSPEKGKYELYNPEKVKELVNKMNSNDNMIFYNPEFDNNNLIPKLSVQGKTYIYDDSLKTLRLSAPKKYSIRGFGVSPDSLYKLISDKYNLWQEDMSSHSRKQLTFDGAKDFEAQVADIEWSTNGYYYLLRNDSRNVRTLTVLNSLATPVPIVSTYKYELPGDTVVATQQLLIGNVKTGTLKVINTAKWRWQRLQLLKADGVNDKVYFLRLKRTRDEYELCSADMATGSVKVIIHEVSKPYLNEELFRVQIENNGNDIFVWSDRSGWGHYYHYSGDGKLLNAVTSGSWTAGRILQADNQHHLLYIYGYGREKNINPNYALVYKVNYNGKQIKLLTPENATHSVFISPSGNLLFDNFSRIDTVPQIEVRSTEGKLLSLLERVDVSQLTAYGWKYPEQFTVKAADGVTDLYGIMWKPYDFDPSKKYPVVSQVYPGPQIETVWTDFTVFDKYNNTALAQRGIIVVCMGHRGGSPYREKKYATYGYGNLRDYAIEDDKCGLEQLAQKYPFIDINRVGIYGHSGGAAMAVTAICTYPDFYKVAVASSGNHDNTLYNRNWGETYQGIGDDNKFKVKTNQEIVKNLKGKLLLVTGETDENVHPSQTMRVVSQLIHNNKDFDMLVLPGQSHHYEEPYKSYFEQRERDYFSKYLLNK